MDIERLREFTTVAKFLSFSKAAEKLYCSQSALSKRISATESELGIALFDRSHERIALTPHGEAFLADARRIVLEYDKAIENLQQAKAMKPMSVKICSFSPYYKPFDDQLRMVTRILKNRLPLFRIETLPITLDPLEHVRGGDIDICAITLAKSFKAPDLTVIPLFDDPLMAIVRNAHRLSDRQAIFASEITDEDIVHLPASAPYSHSSNAIIEQLDMHGVHPLIIEHDWSLPSMFDYSFKDGIYLTTVGAAKSMSIAADAAQYRELRFKDDDMIGSFQLVYLKDTDNEACSIFADAMLKRIASVDMSFYW